MIRALSGLALGAVFAATSVIALPSAERGEVIKIDPVRERAMKAPVSELSRDALGRVASEFVEVERPNFIGIAGPNAPLWGLTFATRATSAGDPGLCEATVTRVHFRVQSVSDTEPPLSTQTVYKIVSDLKPLPDMWNDRYGAELSAKCNYAGRVLPTEERNFGQEQFFEAKVDGGVRVWFAARALEIGLSDTRKHPENVRCEAFDPKKRLNEDCKKELTSQETLRLGRLLSASMTNCNKGSKTCYVVSGVFLRSAVGNSRRTWVMHLKAIIPDTNATGDVREVSDIGVDDGFAIFD